MLRDNDEASAQDQTIDQWLNSLGFSFNPFRTLNAGEDDRLAEYLVAHEAFLTIQSDQISFVFAEAGGGKSAFRVRLARACRVGENGRRLFPIVYLIPQTAILAPEPDRFLAHLKAILQAAAYELLLRLAYRPHEFTALDQSDRRMVRSLLEQGLPSPLSHLLVQAQTPADLLVLAQAYDPTARWPKPPNAERLRNFCQAIEETPSLKTDLPLAEAFKAWLDLLRGPLNFEAVYLLLDGIDAYPETQDDQKQALAILRPLLDQAAGWARQRLYLKAFLPTEMEALLSQVYPSLIAAASISRIEWTHELLADLLKRRLEVAAGTAPASLDMLSDPGLRHTERLIVNQVKLLPREVLSFVERLFFEHIQRVGRPAGKLTREDMQAAAQWYQATFPGY